MLISKENSILVIIDIQEHLNPVMMEPRKVIKYSANLLKIANLLEVPHIITEQVPEKLGQTIIDIREQSNNNPISKTAFDCTKEPEFIEQLNSKNKKQIILTGIENHICVLQTAISLKSLGFDVFVVTNATSSRKEVDFSNACDRMKENNIYLTTYEMVVFEWIKDAKEPNFKEISKNFIDRN